MVAEQTLGLVENMGDSTMMENKARNNIEIFKKNFLLRMTILTSLRIMIGQYFGLGRFWIYTLKNLGFHLQWHELIY